MEKTENKNETKILSYFLNMKAKTKLVLISVIVLILVFCIGVLIYTNKSGSFSTISTASLKEVFEISELSTLDYDYNAIAKKYIDDDNTKDIQYYVSYKGTVTAGIDFNKIDIKIDKSNKKIIIILPEIELQNYRVDNNSLEYIFVKEKYETETIYTEAYKLCKADLKNRTENEQLIKDSAKENAISTIKAIFEPIVESIDKSYEIVIK